MPTMPPIAIEDSAELAEIDMDMDELRVTFFQEADENVATMEAALQELETSTEAELPHRLYRAAHSLKGAGAMLGLDALASFMHIVESTLDLVRRDEIQRGATLKAALITTVDATRAFLAIARAKGEGEVAFQPAIDQLAAAAQLKLAVAV